MIVSELASSRVSECAELASSRVGELAGRTDAELAGVPTSCEQASRARVDCVQTSSQSGYLNIPSSQTTRARTRVREGRKPIANPTAYFKAWREAQWGGDFDPVREAVEEAVAAFSSGKSADGQANDRRVWLKIANRIGFENFLDALYQKSAEIREDEQRGKRLRAPAAAFQKLLNARFPKEGGAA